MSELIDTFCDDVNNPPGALNVGVATDNCDAVSVVESFVSVVESFVSVLVVTL